MNLERIKKKTAQMILQFSIPSIIAMVLTSLITIVDGFFIGNYVGKEGIAAVVSFGNRGDCFGLTDLTQH